MNEFRARIGRIRMKNGGADVRVIEGCALPRDEDEGVAATLHRTTLELTQEADLAAFVIVGWTAQGSVSFNWRYTDQCPMARTLIPPYVAELTRRYVVSREEASERFHEMFEWVE
jgi:hypothetical protein